jgi:hypothetical protein
MMPPSLHSGYLNEADKLANVFAALPRSSFCPMKAGGATNRKVLLKLVVLLVVRAIGVGTRSVRRADFVFKIWSRCAADDRIRTRDPLFTNQDLSCPPGVVRCQQVPFCTGPPEISCQ